MPCKQQSLPLPYKWTVWAHGVGEWNVFMFLYIVYLLCKNVYLNDTFL